MKKYKILMVLVIMCAMLTGCNQEPENNYLGNLKVSYFVNMNGDKVEQSKFEFFYGSALTTYINQYYSAFADDYASMISFQIEENVNDLANQSCTMEGYEDKTWEYYFAYQAMEDLQEVEALVLAAEDKGYVITKEDTKKAKASYVAMETYCKENDISINDYLHSTFGLDATKEVLIENYEYIEMATRYADTLLVEPTNVQIEDYYASHKDAIDTVTIRYFAFSEENKEDADAFASSVTSGQDFQNLAIQYSSDENKIYYESNDLSLRTDIRKEDLPEYLQEILFDETLSIGTVQVVEGTNSYDVVMLVAREKPMYQQANISTIYLDARESDTDTLTSEKLAVCKEFADTLLSTFIAETDGSIEQFHEYNSTYSDDKNNQGDYDAISKGDSTKEISNWVFDSQREYGDMQVLASTNGYTIVYFRELGEADYYQRSKELAKDDLYDQKLTTLKEKVVVSLKE